MGAWATSSCLHVSTILSVFFPSSPGNAFNLLLPPIRQVESFLFISAEAEEENTVVALPSPPPTSKTALAFSTKIDFPPRMEATSGRSCNQHEARSPWQRWLDPGRCQTLVQIQHTNVATVFLASVWFWGGFQASDTGGNHALQHSSSYIDVL